jgi:hypothetical protein
MAKNRIFFYKPPHKRDHKHRFSSFLGEKKKKCNESISGDTSNL